jgi:hypothetical protein
MSANQRCHVCWATGKPGCECPSCDKPECPFAERDKRRREMFAQFAIDVDKPGPLAHMAQQDGSGVTEVDGQSFCKGDANE